MEANVGDGITVGVRDGTSHGIDVGNSVIGIVGAMEETNVGFVVLFTV